MPTTSKVGQPQLAQAAQGRRARGSLSPAEPLAEQEVHFCAAVPTRADGHTDTLSTRPGCQEGRAGSQVKGGLHPVQQALRCASSPPVC